MNGDVKTKIIKRNGEEVTFDLDKIINAITKANEEVTKIHQMNQYQIMANRREGCRSGSKLFSCGECRRYPEYGRDRNHGDERI